MTGPQTADRDQTRVELDLTGMTCAACAARIERKLNRLGGVTATVNYATERAAIDVPSGHPVDVEQLIAAVQSIGYGAAVPPPPSASAGDADRTDAYLDDLRRRLGVAAVLGLPVLVLSMVPATQFSGWQWVAAGLTAPVALWSASPFHRTAWRNARQAGRSNMAFVQADVGDPPPLFEGYFDAISCCLAFHHYPDGAAAIRAFRRVLKPGGMAFVADPGPKWFNDMSRPWAKLADPGFVQHRTGTDFQMLFRQAGFAEVYWVEALPGIGITVAST